MKIKSLLLASTVALIATTGAKAADAIVEEPAPVIVAEPVFSWTGAYIGGQIGYGWGKSEFEDAFRVKPDGFLGGLYAGYNFDVGNNFILGIDGDITYNNLKDNYSATDGDIAGDLESKLRWSGAVRARAGVAFDRFMPYIAGGVAFGSVKTRFQRRTVWMKSAYRKAKPILAGRLVRVLTTLLLTTSFCALNIATLITVRRTLILARM